MDRFINWITSLIHYYDDVYGYPNGSLILLAFLCTTLAFSTVLFQLFYVFTRLANDIQ